LWNILEGGRGEKRQVVKEAGSQGEGGFVLRRREVAWFGVVWRGLAGFGVFGRGGGRQV